jgi:hypothetical protein
LKEGVYTINLKTKLNYYYVNSNDLIIKIKKPGVTEDRDMLKKIFSMNDDVNKLDSMRKYIYEHPNSAYLDFAIREFVRVMPCYNGKPGELIKDFKQYLLTQYNSANISYNLTVIFEAISKKVNFEEMINFLVYICKKYSGTKAGSSAKEILQREIPNGFYVQDLLR